jgi:hypothetical protein
MTMTNDLVKGKLLRRQPHVLASLPTGQAVHRSVSAAISLSIFWSVWTGKE